MVIYSVTDACTLTLLLVSIHRLALTAYSQMSTGMYQGFNHFSGFLQYFVLAELATSSIRVKGLL